MIKKLFILITTLALFGFNNNPEPIKETKTLKVITYNIWNGFDWGKDVDRKEKLVTWVKAQNPDVMALQELCGYTQEQLLIDAKKWGHNYAQILKTTGYSVGITSKEPIEVKEKIITNPENYTITFYEEKALAENKGTSITNVTPPIPLAINIA